MYVCVSRTSVHICSMVCIHRNRHSTRAIICRHVIITQTDTDEPTRHGWRQRGGTCTLLLSVPPDSVSKLTGAYYWASYSAACLHFLPLVAPSPPQLPQSKQTTRQSWMQLQFA